MYFLVRRLTGRGAGEALESDYQGQQLTLGEGGMVELPGESGSLILTPAGADSASFGAKKLAVKLNGEPVRSGKLGLEDSLEIPGYSLALMPAPPGFDLAVSLEPVHRAAGSRYPRLELERSNSPVRTVSWILAITILLTCLLVPLLAVFDQDTAQLLRDAPLPDDGLWSTGPLVSAHATAGVAEDCNACHSEPFVMVEDQACMSCHRDMNEHADLAVHSAADFTDTRCASCHREHNEPAQLVVQDNGLCVDCHADPAPWEVPGGSGMGGVTAFTAKDHPEFRLAMLQPKGPGGAHGWEIERQRVAPTDIKESSNLKFNHQVHLDSDKVQDEASGEALACADCHGLQEDGQHFAPITMDNHCRSCHSLSFDVLDPDVELPHGDLRSAIVAMEAHFIREFTDPELRSQRAGKKPRRVPGKRQALASCEGSGLDCGRAEAAREAEYQFLETGCITCHEVTDTGASDISDRWYVQPVRITGDWYPKHPFDHSAHLAFSPSGEAEICSSCHAALSSEQSTDVLIPAKDNCLECHDDRLGDAAVSCVGCHSFHMPGGTPASSARKSVVSEGGG